LKSITLFLVPDSHNQNHLYYGQSSKERKRAATSALNLTASNQTHTKEYQTAMAVSDLEHAWLRVVLVPISACLLLTTLSIRFPKFAIASAAVMLSGFALGPAKGLKKQGVAGHGISALNKREQNSIFQACRGTSNSPKACRTEAKTEAKRIEEARPRLLLCKHRSAPAPL